MSERASQLKAGWAGIVLTGWARYDHFAVLCELLPVAIPSLLINLLVVSLGGLHFPVSRKIHNILGCDNIKMLISIEELRRNPQQWDVTRCNFPGLQVRTWLGSKKSFKLMSTLPINFIIRFSLLSQTSTSTARRSTNSITPSLPSRPGCQPGMLSLYLSS